MINYLREDQKNKKILVKCICTHKKVNAENTISNTRFNLLIYKIKVK